MKKTLIAASLLGATTFQACSNAQEITNIQEQPNIQVQPEVQEQTNTDNLVNGLCTIPTTEITNCTETQEIMIKEINTIAKEYRAKVFYMFNHLEKTLYMTQDKETIMALRSDNIIGVCQYINGMMCSVLLKEGIAITPQEFIQKFRKALQEATGNKIEYI